MTKFETALKKYLDIFATQEMYFVNDLKNLELFQKTPGNKDAEDIRMKVSAINDTEISNLGILENVVSHIHSLNIDDRLKKDDLTLVEDIANFSVGARPQRVLHFASVYCNFHKPDVYPIYSEQHIDFYRKYITENKLSLDPSKINTYDIFTKALNDLVQRLGLKGKMNYRHLRKFGWLYAEHVVKEGAA
ncbi:MAG TPA: hypothetical protein VK589_10785 [Chryseolinea sp.]|nr:hypothetical protein [Chryseolinea sp.]